MGAPDIYGFEVKDIKGNLSPLEKYRNQVLLIVNTASKCGFTPQFEGLQKLYENYADRGFMVLGFPCNQFMNQDPGNEEQISQFCSLNYGVSFPMFAKVDVNGEEAHPLYVHLKQAARGLLGSEGIKWNFTKFLVGRNGDVIRRYPPTAKPEDIAQDIEKLL